MAEFIIGALVFALGAIFGSAVTRTTYNDILDTPEENNGI